jgi:hypothetical protein
MVDICNWKGATQVMHLHLQHAPIMIAVAKAIVFFVIFDCTIENNGKVSPEQ